MDNIKEKHKNSKLNYTLQSVPGNKKYLGIRKRLFSIDDNKCEYTFIEERVPWVNVACAYYYERIYTPKKLYDIVGIRFDIDVSEIVCPKFDIEDPCRSIVLKESKK